MGNVVSTCFFHQ